MEDHQNFINIFCMSGLFASTITTIVSLSHLLFVKQKKTISAIIILSISLIVFSIMLSILKSNNITLFLTFSGVFIVSITLFAIFINYKTKKEYNFNVSKTLDMLAINDDFSLMFKNIQEILKQIEINENYNSDEMNELNNQLVAKKNKFFEQVNEFNTNMA